MDAKVWLVSGSGRGLGRSIIEAALAAGHKVVAGARDTRQLADLVKQYGHQIYPVTLDVTDMAQAHAAVAAAVEEFGQLDVLVNNAGYGHTAAFEMAEPDDVRAQIETNLFGVINLTRAALPVMRKQRSGHILQVSSVGGRQSTPGLAAYQAAKWAVGGFSDVVQMEVAPLGIQVTTLEPGGMKTGWARIARTDRTPVHPDYAATVGHIAGMLDQYAGKENSDPARVAQIILRVAGSPAAPVRLLLGSDAVQLTREVEALRTQNDARWREVSVAADAGATTFPALPRLEQGADWDIAAFKQHLGATRAQGAD